MCQSLELRAAIMGTYLKESRNNSEAVFGKSARNGETTKAFKIQMEAGLSKFENYVLENLRTRGKMKEALSCMFETWHNPIARPLWSN